MLDGKRIASSPKRRKSVTYVSGTICYLCLGSLTIETTAVQKIGVTNCHGSTGQLKLFSQLFEAKIHSSGIVRPQNRWESIYQDWNGGDSNPCGSHTVRNRISCSNLQVGY
jgi:hypothetical protein